MFCLDHTYLTSLNMDHQYLTFLDMDHTNNKPSVCVNQNFPDSKKQFSSSFQINQENPTEKKNQSFMPWTFVSYSSMLKTFILVD